MDQPVFIDGSSVLVEDSPEYVVYQEIHETSKMYMRSEFSIRSVHIPDAEDCDVDVVAIESSWLAVYAPQMCTLSTPLHDPAPFYNQDDDCVMAFVSGTFGPYSWPLPVTAIPYPECEDKFKWFATFLLLGQVDHRLLYFSSHLLSNPRILFKSWIRLQPAMLSIVQRLHCRRVCSLSQLHREWHTEPNCEFLISVLPATHSFSTDLIPELQKWIPQNMHLELTEKLQT